MNGPATNLDFERLSSEELAAWGGFLHAHAKIVRRLDAELRAQHGLSLSAYEILLRLALAPEAKRRMSELAASVLLSPSGITRACDRLVRDGLIERCGDEEDHRATCAILTDAGRARLAEAQRTHLAGVRETFLEHLSPDDRARLSDVWARILG